MLGEGVGVVTEEKERARGGNRKSSPAAARLTACAYCAYRAYIMARHAAVP